jgi:hypothetical protein
LRNVVAVVRGLADARLAAGIVQQEKRQLGQDIHKLPEDRVHRVIDIINESGCQMGGNDEEVEIDIEKLDTATLRSLQKYVREILRQEKKKVAKEAAF